jgi:hypothetical protein
MTAGDPHSKNCRTRLIVTSIPTGSILSMQQEMVRQASLSFGCRPTAPPGGGCQVLMFSLVLALVVYVFIVPMYDTGCDTV